MSAVRIESVAEPFASDRSAATKAARLVARAEFLGALPDDPLVRRELGRPLIQQILRQLADRGVATRTGLLEHAAWTTHYDALLDAVLEQTEHSPMPGAEWGPLTAVLGEDLLAELLGVSPTSLRRYASNRRLTPQDVAGRLHFLALLVADLAGGYNDYGIRRWFARPRTQLDGRQPRELLGPGFDPDGADADRLRELAAALLGAGAT